MPSFRGGRSIHCARTRSGSANRSRNQRRIGISMNTESLKAGTAGIGDALQSNWVPLSLIGVGIAWLVATNTGLAERVANDERVQAAGRKIGELAGDIGIGGDGKDHATHGGHVLG